MADETFDEEGLGGEGEGGSKKLSPKKLVLFVVLPLLLLIGAGVGVTIMLGIFDSPPPAEEESAEGAGAQAAKPEAPPAQTQAVFFEVPDLIVNLNTSGRKATFLKIKVALEITNPSDIDIINQVLPRIVDDFQVYLRELRVEDLQGSAGLHRLREELLRRVNLSVRPARVQAVLFKEMLVQ